jgi:hypothetical protein
LASGICTQNSNPMPESVTDRPTKAHEYLFLLTKEPDYYYDALAIADKSDNPARPTTKANALARNFGREGTGNEGSGRAFGGNGVANKRSVWTIPTAPYKAAHFATFPPMLVQPCVLAGTSAEGCCPKCGAPWERVIKPTAEYREKLEKARDGNDWYQRIGSGEGNKKCLGKGSNRQGGISASYETIGWKPGCRCRLAEPIPCRVLDPFAGSGTTLMVAERLGRDAVGIELKPQYVKLLTRRVGNDHVQPRVRQQSLWSYVGTARPLEVK